MKESLQQLLRDRGCLTSREIDRYYQNQNKFGTAFVINMASRTERMASATETLKKVGLAPTRFGAVVGKEITNPFYLESFSILRPGELGCLLSHMSIAALAADHPDQEAFTLIFEDDVVTSSGKDALRMAFQRVENIDREENIQMIYLGKCLERCGQMVQVEDNIYRAVAPSCLHGYAIKNSFARRVLQDFDRCSKYDGSLLNCDYYNRGIDSIYGDYIINGLIKALVFHPSIFYQDVLSGGSDLRQEYMINYQECNDTNPPCSGGEKEVEVRRHQSSPFLLVAVIILIIVLLIVVMLWQRKRVGPILKHPATRWTGVGIVMVAVLILAIVWIVKMAKKSKGKNEPSWLKDFKAPPTAILHTLTDYSSSGPKHFPLDSRKQASKEYQIFNPNGILVMASQMESPEFSDDSWARDRKSHLALLTTSRASNGKVSYPLVQVFNSTATKIKYSNMLSVQSHRSMQSSDIIGYEDMRVFKYREEFYLIGVNLDRHPKTLPGMFMVKLDQSFNSSTTWHLKFPPLANVPNKNWSPLTLPDGELGLIVDIDPLLIVRRTKKLSKKSGQESYSGKCEVAYAVEKQTDVEKVRNSTVTFDWNTLSINTQDALSVMAPDLERGYHRYVLMGHTKYVEADFMKDGWRVIYQHYFALIDLPKASAHAGSANPGIPKVYFSKPFYVEEHDRPHIEYISGVCFLPAGRDHPEHIMIMYGLQDRESKYLRLDPSELKKLLSK